MTYTEDMPEVEVAVKIALFKISHMGDQSPLSKLGGLKIWVTSGRLFTPGLVDLT